MGFVDGVFLTEHYEEIPENERYDVIPEMWNGHNIADYVDSDIAAVSQLYSRKQVFLYS